MTPTTLYAVGVPGRGIFKSINRGESWVSIKAGQGVGFLEIVTALVVDPVSPSTIYAAAHVDTGPNSADEIIYKSSDGGQNWRAVRVGIPAGASISSLAIDPGSPSRIYATYSANAAGGGWGMTKSTDGAESWAAMNAGLPSGDFIASPVVIDPSSPTTLYIGYVDRGGTGAGGIVKSTDGAASWNPANAGRRFIDVRTMAIDPMNPGTNYTSIGSDGVFKTVDGGETWQKLAAFQFSRILGFSGQAYVRSVAIDFRRPNILYALAARSDGCHFLDELLFKSTDGGVTWIDSASPPMSGCTLSGAAPMVMDPTDPTTLYLEGNLFDYGLSLYKSTDGGATWNDPVCCVGDALVIDPSNPGTLYNGTPYGVFKSTDGIATWSLAGLDRSVNVLALDPANPSILYAATYESGSTAFAGLFKSSDSGASWFAINDGLASLLDTGAPLNSLVIDPRNSSLLYAGTSGYGVFRSTDGGAHWSPFNDGLTNLDVRLLALAPGKANLYAGTGNGMFVIDLASDTIPFIARGRGSW